MNAMIRSEFPPLACDRNDQQFLPPESARGWKARRLTEGRAITVKTDQGALIVDLHATHEEFEEAVNHRPGIYRLYPVDHKGNEVPGPVAHVEIFPLQIDSQEREYLTRVDRAFEIVDRLVQSHEHKDLMLSDITKTLIASHTDLQRGVGDLMNAATQTIRVASGVEAVERPAPVIDVDELGSKLADTIGQNKQQEPPLWMQLMNGPWGLAALQFVQAFAQSAMQAQAAQAQQDDTEPENQ